MIYIIGGRGRLGKAIIHKYSSAQYNILDRGIYQGWSSPNSADKVAYYFENKIKTNSLIFIASGLLNPKISQEELNRINFHLPKNIIDGATKHGIKVVTFGTVMEGLLQTTNKYIYSKTLLGEYIEKKSSSHFPALHLKIHTLYGSAKPSPHMFLGQIYNAICHNLPFNMTYGNQLREYHHIMDEVNAIQVIVDQCNFGAVDIHHGNPVSLKDLALSVFKFFNKLKLLRIGMIDQPENEIYVNNFKRPEILNNIKFRDTLTNVIKYIKEINEI